MGIKKSSDEMGRKTRVVMSGPLPPSIGGMTTAISDLNESKVSEVVDFVLFNTAKQTSEGRPFWKGILSRLSLMMLWWRTIANYEGVTIVHIHTCSGLTFFLDAILLFLAKARGVPVILHIHGGRFAEFLDGLGVVFNGIARAVSKRADLVVVLSEEWQRVLEARLPDSKFRVIRNGVAVADHHFPRISRKESRVTLLFIGNLCEAKGVLDLIEAMRYLKGRAKLVFVGPCLDEVFLQKVNSRLSAYGLDNDIILAGPCLGEKKQRWLKSADIFVLPSHVEALPISLLEAMALSLPVVATTVGAIPSVIQHGKEGFLFPPRDEKLLAELLQKLVDDESLRGEMGLSGYLRCKSEYNLDLISDIYIDVYRDLSNGQLP